MHMLYTLGNLLLAVCACLVSKLLTYWRSPALDGGGGGTDPLGHHDEHLVMGLSRRGSCAIGLDFAGHRGIMPTNRPASIRLEKGGESRIAREAAR